MSTKHVAATTVALAILGVSALASAEWEVDTTPGGTYNMAIDAQSETNVWVFGMRFDTSNLFAPIIEAAFQSTDGGDNFTDRSGSLATNGTAVPNAVGVFGDVVLLADDDRVIRTVDDGGTWTPTLTDHPMRDFAQAGAAIVAVGDDGAVMRSTDQGASWADVSTPADTDLRHVYFANANDGWAVGHQVRTTGGGFDDEEEETFWESGMLVFTHDGGASWSMGATFGDVAPGPVFFLGDGQTGWVATSAREDSTGNASIAAVHVTTNGGVSFDEISFPTTVGRLTSAFGDDPIDTAVVHAMYWEDAQRGRVAGVAHLADAEVSDSQSGTTADKTVWRVVDYVTEDGGATWTHTELGDIEMEFSFEGPQIPSDGGINQGLLLSRYQGWMVGDTGRVWRLDEGCSDDSACGEGMVCAAGMCVDEERVDADTGVIIQDDAGTSGTDAGTSGSDTGGGRRTPTGTGTDEGGCAVAPTTGVGSWAWLGLGLLWFRRRR